MPCSICQNLRPNTILDLRTDQVALLWVNAKALAESAAIKDCDECSLLGQAIQVWHPDWLETVHKWPILRLEVAIGRPVQLKFRPAGAEGSTDIHIYRLPGYQGSQIADTIGYGPSIPEFSGSQESLAKIKAWNSECQESHELCRVKHDGRLPTRLLRIEKNKTYLVHTKDLDLLPYVALSYCWGDPIRHAVVKTLKSNYESHQMGMDITVLPAVLQDAINLASILGYNFIWIDALCITQDDPDDWASEAATMCRVYSDAAITIVASQSDGVGSSLFGKQSYSEHTLLAYKDIKVAVAHNINRSHDFQIVTPVGFDDQDPIVSRAWTLQEAVLSNRAIHITSKELRWECNTCRRCQCGKIDTDFPHLRDPEFFQYENSRIWRLESMFPADSIDDAYFMWHTMVTYYSKRQLTNASDRLVAIGGLAARFGSILQQKFNRGDTYIAGLWRNALLQDILWYVEPRKFSVAAGIKHRRPEKWRAPSWSWASMEAPVNYQTHTALLRRAEFVDVECENYPDMYGQVRAATLKIRAPMLCDVRLILGSEESGSDRYTHVRYQDLDLRVSSSYIDDDRDEETDRYLTNENQVFSLVVIGYLKSSDLHETLLLTPVFEKPGHFERIGRIRLGQHLMEPKSHAQAIENAPIEEIILL